MSILGIIGKGLDQPLDLNGITQGGAGAVGFNVTDGAWINIGPFQALFNHIRMGRRVWYGKAAGLAAMVDGTALDNGVYVVAVGQGLIQGLEKNRADAFP